MKILFLFIIIIFIIHDIEIINFKINFQLVQKYFIGTNLHDLFLFKEITNSLFC